MIGLRGRIRTFKGNYSTDFQRRTDARLRNYTQINFGPHIRTCTRLTTTLICGALLHKLCEVGAAIRNRTGFTGSEPPYNNQVYYSRKTFSILASRLMIRQVFSFSEHGCVLFFWSGWSGSNRQLKIGSLARFHLRHIRLDLLVGLEPTYGH